MKRCQYCSYAEEKPVARLYRFLCPTCHKEVQKLDDDTPEICPDCLTDMDMADWPNMDYIRGSGW